MRLVWLCVLSVYAKYVSLSLSLSEASPWKYITKFAVDVGTGNYTLRARFLSPVEPGSQYEWPFQVPIYIDTQWDEVLYQVTCEAKLRSAKNTKLLTIPKSGEWSEPISGNLTQKMRPYFWFLALADCTGEVREELKIKLEIVLFNADGSHLSLEDKNLDYLYFGSLLIFLGVLSSSGVQLFLRFRKIDSLDKPLTILNCAIFAQILAITFALFHHWYYSYNGKGVPILDFFSQSLDLISQLLIHLLLILVSLGWTIQFKHFPDIETSIPVSFFVAVLHFSAAGLSRLGDDAEDKFSMVDGSSGLMVLLLRLCLYGLFLFGAKRLYQRSQGVVQTLIWDFGAMASLYFLAVPVFAGVSYFFAPYLRNKVVVVCNFIVQLIAFIVLAHLFSEKSTYHKVSTFSDSVLPGNKYR